MNWLRSYVSETKTRLLFSEIKTSFPFLETKTAQEGKRVWLGIRIRGRTGQESRFRPQRERERAKETDRKRERERRGSEEVKRAILFPRSLVVSSAAELEFHAVQLHLRILLVTLRASSSCSAAPLRDAGHGSHEDSVVPRISPFPFPALCSIIRRGKRKQHQGTPPLTGEQRVVARLHRVRHRIQVRNFFIPPSPVESIGICC